MSTASQMLELPEVRARVSPLSVAEYHRLSEYDAAGRRTELIRGIVVQKMSKSPLHSSIARRLHRMLQELLPPGCVLLREDPLTLTDSEPEPDLAVVRGRESDFVGRHPSTAAIVIEIAVSPAAEDRSLTALYAEANVEEYWIVFPLDRRIEIYRAPLAGIYQLRSTVEGDATLPCECLPGIQIKLADLFA